MTKKRKIIIGLVIGIPVFLIALAAVLITLMEPPIPEPVAPIEEKELPADWLANTGNEEGIQVQTGSETTRGEEKTKPAEPDLPYKSSGMLSFLSDGKPFGTETYELTISEEGAALHSSGYFQFKIVVATIRVTYTQTLNTDHKLKPTDYYLDFRAPLGFGQEIEAQFSSESLNLMRNEQTETISVDPSRLLVLGTFSTYALVPALFEARAKNGRSEFDVLILGGPPRESAPEGGSSNSLSMLTIERVKDVTLQVGTRAITVDQYRVTSEMGESTLLGKGKEFLAFIAGDEDESMVVYRSDYFPTGLPLGPSGSDL